MLGKLVRHSHGGITDTNCEQMTVVVRMWDIAYVSNMASARPIFFRIQT